MLKGPLVLIWELDMNLVPTLVRMDALKDTTNLLRFCQVLTSGSGAAVAALKLTIDNSMRLKGMSMIACGCHT